MAKKKKSPEAILKRAETLYGKKSYQAALKEYQKYKRVAPEGLTDTVSSHIEQCERETALLRAKELVKKGRKLLSRGKLEQALECFEKAHAVTGDRQLADMISELRVKSAGMDKAASADRAEADGDYLKAAEILAQLYEAKSDKGLLCRQAHCLVLAEQWDQALELYVQVECSSPAEWYNYGFAQAKSGHYGDCLNSWQNIRSKHPDFIVQKKNVSELYIQKLANDLNQAQRNNALFEEAGTVLEQLESVADLGDDGQNLLARCRSLRLGQLWQEDRLWDIRKMLPEADTMNSAELAIHAKTAYQLLDQEGAKAPLSLVYDFIDYWLSALLHPETGWKYPDGSGETDRTCQALLDMGYTLIRKFSEQHPEIGSTLTEQWKENLVQLKTIASLISAQTENETGLAPYSPAPALKAGLGEQLFVLLEKHEEAFPDKAAFLATGAAYSLAGKAMIMARDRDYEGSLQEITFLEKVNQDPFLDRGAAQVKLECGLNELEKGQYREAERLINPVLSRLVDSGSLTGKLLAVLEQSIEYRYNLERLASSVNILSTLQKILSSQSITHHRSEAVNALLCVLLTEQAFILSKNKKANIRITVKSLEKAAALNPGNEHTRVALREVRIAHDASEIDTAIGQMKIAKAARIAIASDYPEVRDIFFSFCKECYEGFDKMANLENQKYKRLFLQDFLTSCRNVDPLHPVTMELEDALDELDELDELN